MSIKGYKVFNPDWTCRGMKYEVGQTYKHDGPISICQAGFHFCRKVADCFSYYSFDPQNKVAEVEATGLVESDNNKSVTDEIKIIREIPWAEMLELANEGKGNTGLKNTGDCNTGDCNTGNWNTGNWNTGNCNTGFFSTLTPKIDLDAIEELNMKLHGDEAAIVGMKREIERMVVAGRPRWIPVTERLPESGARCLVTRFDFVTNTPFIDLLWFDNSWWDRLNSGEYAVTHWMPLPPAPEPPKEEA